MTMSRHRVLVGALLLVLLPSGCVTPTVVERKPLPALTMVDAIRVSDANAALVTATVRAAGSVDGHFTQEGRRRHYRLDGVLFFLAPDFVRFDLKKLGDRQLLFGSNQEQFWIYNKQDDEYFCGHQGDPEEMPPELPIRPDQIADALGLRLIGDMRAADGAELVQRVVDDAQQILILVRDVSGRPVVEKEYWLDRYPPRLVRRVVFRDENGVVEMSSELSGYRRVEPDGPLLPYEMTAEWPGSEARMRFSVNKWGLVPQVGPTGPQFATPQECLP